MSDETPKPSVIIGEGTDPSLSVDIDAANDTLQELGVSDPEIQQSAVYIDPKNRLLNLGTHYPNRVGRLRFWNNRELQDVEGDIVRISSVVRGKPRTADQMNKTLVHEWEHLIQQDRRDPKLRQGHATIAGLAIAGALAGGRIGKGRLGTPAGVIAGATVGYFAGTVAAPHERQARSRARQLKTTAIKKK